MNITEGDTVTYVPKQNTGENIHHSATIVGRTKNNLYRLLLDTGKKVSASKKRLIIGQLDAFPVAKEG